MSARSAFDLCRAGCLFGVARNKRVFGSTSGRNNVISSGQHGLQLCVRGWCGLVDNLLLKVTTIISRIPTPEQRSQGEIRNAFEFLGNILRRKFSMLIANVPLTFRK